RKRGSFSTLPFPRRGAGGSGSITIRIGLQVDDDLAGAAAGEQHTGVVVYVGGGEGDASRLLHHPSGRPDTSGASRPVELGAQVGGEEDLATIEQCPGGAAHGGVEDGGHHAAVNDPIVAGRKRVIDGRLPFEHGSAGRNLHPAPAERREDAALAGLWL